MNKEELYASIGKRYEELRQVLTGTDLRKIKELTLEVHALVHPALVSNILMSNQDQIFNSEWQRKIGASITDTGNALEFDEAA